MGKGERSLFWPQGFDINTDQSYFLSQLSQEQLSKSLFPVGELEKKEVRKIALENDLPTAKKKDSTGICFIGERDFKNFLKNYIFSKPGEIHTLNGEVLGHHDGLMYYTIGQRKGLNIGGDNRFKNAPWFVVGKDIENNRLLVGQGLNNPYLFSNRVIVEDINWISKERFVGTLECSAKFRYRQEDQVCLIRWIDKGLIEVVTNKPVRAVTPGQACVFYNGEICLGGGTIKEVYQNQKKLMY